MNSYKTALTWSGVCLECHKAVAYDVETGQLAHAEDMYDDHPVIAEWEVEFMRDVHATTMDDAARAFTRHAIDVFSGSKPVDVWVTLDQCHVRRAGLTPDAPGMWVAISPRTHVEGTPGNPPAGPIGDPVDGTAKYRAGWVSYSSYDADTPFAAARDAVDEVTRSTRVSGDPDELEFAVFARGSSVPVHYTVRATDLAIRDANGVYQRDPK